MLQGFGDSLISNAPGLKVIKPPGVVHPSSSLPTYCLAGSFGLAMCESIPLSNPNIALENITGIF